jgi:hypothetical protein
MSALMNAFFARSVRCGLTFAVSIARGLEMPAASVARAGEMIEYPAVAFEQEFFVLGQPSLRRRDVVPRLQ